MQLDGTFPGRDLDEILEGMSGIENLDDKVVYIQENFSMKEMKKLEDQGSELAEEAMIQTAREKASDEEVERFITEGFNQSWRENPQKGLATIEKAIERHPNKPKNLERGHRWRNQKVDIFRNLLERGHIRTAEKFNELVDGIKIGHYDSEDLERDDDDLNAEDIAEDVYEELTDERWGEGPEHYENIVKIAERFEISNWDVGSIKQEMVEKFAEEDRYLDALRNSQRFEVESTDDDKDIQQIADDGYIMSMDDQEYFEAAKIAHQARMMSDSGFRADQYKEKESEAAKEAFKEEVESGDYWEAKRAISRFNTENKEKEEMQTYLIKKLTNEEIDQDKYQELTEEIGYEPKSETSNDELGTGFDEDDEEVENQDYDELDSGFEDDKDQGGSESYISRINPFS